MTVISLAVGLLLLRYHDSAGVFGAGLFVVGCVLALLGGRLVE